MAEPSRIPAARAFHKTVAVGDSSLYTWAGMVPKLPQVHSSPAKTAYLSKVELFLKDTGEWVQLATSGMPPLGVYGYGCAAVDDDLHFFGGVCGHGDCYHNCVHKLDVLTLEWEVLSPTMSREGIPLKKAHCGMIAFKDDHNSMLFVVGGSGTNPTYHQPGSNYEVVDGRFWCNEQHIFTLNKKEWSSPDVVGQPPPPSEQFTLTLVGERKAALFGGFGGLGAINDLLIVELSRLTVHWTKIVRRTGLMSIFSRELWPDERQGHAAVCLCSSVLMIMGGRNMLNTNGDCWIYNLTTEIWKKLTLPESVTSRMHHSLSVLQISPIKMLLVVFGGRRTTGNPPISNIVTIELIQEGDSQWRVGKIVDGTSHADKMAYKKILKDRNLFEGSIDGQVLQRVIEKLEKEKKQLQQQLQQRTDEIEQKLTRDIKQLMREKEQIEETLTSYNQRLMHEKEQIQQRLFDTEHTLDQMRLRSQRIEERARQTEQQLSSEKEQLTTEKEQVTVEKEQLAAEVVQLQQRANNMEERLTRRYQEHQEELRAANEREAQSRNQVRELQQQLGEGTEGPPSHWVVRRDEVEVTEEIIGRGSWGEVRVANLRGLRVAAKCIHQVILSDHNLRLFRREMTIASLVRHPNMLLFIGATREGEPMILTELMDTSLRSELSKREFSRADIVSIGEDAACALCYLHEWQPSPIIHRDISSSNVLLEPLPNNRWRAKVSDYGSANFMYAIRTGNPGGPLYAAPESSHPDQHSPKMDTFSLGILLVEMCLRELPETNPALRETQIMRVQWEAMVFLVRWCINDNPANRPTMRVVMNLLVGTIDD